MRPRLISPIVRHTLAASISVLLITTVALAQTLLGQTFANKGSQPAEHLTPMERADFGLGQALFERPWATGLTSSSSSDGLGPLFNARACSSCHIDAGRSNALVRPGVAAPNMILEVTTGAGPHPVLGGQLQERASAGLPAEGRRHIITETVPFTYPDGTQVELFRPRVEVVLEPTQSTIDPAEVAFHPRVAPQLWASPALAAIPEAQLEAWADPDDTDVDGISGRIRWVFSLAEQAQMPGRFGWKASTPTLADQIANAFATDMGLSNPLILADAGDCTPAQTNCGRAAAFADDPNEDAEVRPEVFDLVVGYNAHLAEPVFTGDATLWDEGITLFDSLGCSSCHVYQLDDEFTALADPNYPQPPFSDALLHDMGSGLADSRSQGSVAASEWRTAPLRGLGQTLRSNPNAGYLHDGRALSVEQAILWHEGEALRARDAFANLRAAERERLLEFLENL